MTCPSCGIDLAGTTPFDGGVCVACWQTCGRCDHLTVVGDDPIGTCDVGGPDPTGGCSDTHVGETCPRWRAIDWYSTHGVDPGLPGGEPVR